MLHGKRGLRPSVPPLSQRPERFPAPSSAGYSFGGSPGRFPPAAFQSVARFARSSSPESFRGGCSFGAPPTEIGGNSPAWRRFECGSRHRPRVNTWSQNPRPSMRRLARAGDGCLHSGKSPAPKARGVLRARFTEEARTRRRASAGRSAPLASSASPAAVAEHRTDRPAEAAARRRSPAQPRLSSGPICRRRSRYR